MLFWNYFSNIYTNACLSDTALVSLIGRLTQSLVCFVTHSHLLTTE